MAALCIEVARRVFFTSTRLFVQELVAGGTVALVTDSPVPADVRAAAVVVGAFIQACTTKSSEEEEQRQGRARKGM